MSSDTQCILLDIEGTTSSVRFVYEVMFPYAREHVGDYLEHHWQSDATQQAITQMAHDAHFETMGSWFATTDLDPRFLVLDHFVDLMDQDIKATGLKMLQGLIWDSAFKSGLIKAHLYDDVKVAMETWCKHGMRIYIYSSGSIPTQKQFFQHTVAGDLLSYLSGHFDTTTGPKRQAESYRQIANELTVPACEILFISDIVQELDAAREAGMHTLLSMRPENQPVDNTHGHHMICSFEQVT